MRSSASSAVKPSSSSPPGGTKRPGILLPTLAATACSLTVGIVSAKLLERVVR